MMYIRKIKKHNYFALAVGLLVYIGNVGIHFTQPKAGKSIEPDSIRAKYAGSETCKGCHFRIFDSCRFTAHYATSAAPSAHTIKGSFEPGKNHFRYNQWMEVVMEKNGDKFLQKAYMGGAEFQTESMDIVIGSGGKGQTYLYWVGNKLYQLPISYYTPQNNWCNSPGYPVNFIRFDRQITGQCFECHASYVRMENENTDQASYDASTIVYGIDCERCHGPAKDHVVYHQSHPDDNKPRFIISIRSLSRQQQLDACALCHSGLRTQLRPSFTFKTGDTLNNYSQTTYNPDSTSLLDVHGNQYGLLTASRCFEMSAMNCSSCHDTHVNEKNSPKIFSSRCMNCHNATTHIECKFKPSDGLVLGDNCIDCHMPLLPSKKIFLQLDNPENSSPDFVRTHRIAIYPKIAEEFAGKKRGNENPVRSEK